MFSLKGVLFFCCAVLLLGNAAHAALPPALIDLDANTLTTTSMVTWPNAGSLGGKFNISVGTSVTVSTVSGRKAATFTGANGMLSTFTPATAITGTSATYTVSYWALNPNTVSEEWILTWAPRNKGNGTYAGFGYGRNPAWGFTAHWGMVYDSPFGDQPTTNTWHHIAVTYDGYVEKGYVDGVLNMVASKKMNIGSEAFKLGYADTATNPLGFSGSLAKLQVFDKTLTSAQILELYGSTPAKPATLPAPLLDLEAADLTTGTLASWLNSGALGGTFNLALGSAPTVEMVSGYKAVTFSGTNGLQADVAPPTSLRGNGKFTVAYWVLNPAVATEEWLLQWAPRNKGNGTYAAFGYGTSGTFGLAAHWGDAADFPFGTAVGGGVAGSGVPKAGAWHHIVITFDGATEKAYVDGSLNNQENKTLNLGYENFKLGYNEGTNINFSGSLSKVQVWDVPFTATQVLQLYNSPRVPVRVNPVKNWSMFE